VGWLEGRANHIDFIYYKSFRGGKDIAGLFEQFVVMQNVILLW
jgi:hypothetical protein